MLIIANTPAELRAKGSSQVLTRGTPWTVEVDLDPAERWTFDDPITQGRIVSAMAEHAQVSRIYSQGNKGYIEFIVTGSTLGDIFGGISKGIETVLSYPGKLIAYTGAGAGSAIGSIGGAATKTLSDATKPLTSAISTPMLIIGGVALVGLFMMTRQGSQNSAAGRIIEVVGPAAGGAVKLAALA